MQCGKKVPCALIFRPKRAGGTHENASRFESGHEWAFPRKRRVCANTSVMRTFYSTPLDANGRPVVYYRSCRWKENTSLGTTPRENTPRLKGYLGKDEGDTTSGRQRRASDTAPYKRPPAGQAGWNHGCCAFVPSGRALFYWGQATRRFYGTDN